MSDTILREEFFKLLTSEGTSVPRLQVDHDLQKMPSSFGWLLQR